VERRRTPGGGGVTVDNGPAARAPKGRPATAGPAAAKPNGPKLSPAKPNAAKPTATAAKPNAAKPTATAAKPNAAKPTAAKPTAAKPNAPNAKRRRPAAAPAEPAVVWNRPPVAVLVIDGDSESRHRLSQIITRSEHLVLSGSVGTLADAIEVARRTKPEVVLSELFLPDGDPAALKHRFVPLAPRPQLVVITRFSVRGARVASTVAGARTCLASTAPPDSVLAAVLAAANGESWDGAGAVGSRLDRVSPLEAKVLAGVASGATNEEIARALGYSVHYVKDLLEAVRGRLGAKDRAHAAALAVSLRLIRPARDGRFISAVPTT
jgi:DNA-binding NarL/FixJ family response regulator